MCQAQSQDKLHLTQAPATGPVLDVAQTMLSMLPTIATILYFQLMPISLFALFITKAYGKEREAK